VVAHRFEVWLTTLNPTVGSEIQKTRPCLIVSPDEMNRHLSTVIVAPMTTGGRLYPSRVECEFEGTSGHVALDQIRTVDKARLMKRLGVIADPTASAVLDTLQSMFAP
jgi:mRNA interferase MazF